MFSSSLFPDWARVHIPPICREIIDDPDAGKWFKFDQRVTSIITYGGPNRRLCSDWNYFNATVAECRVSCNPLLVTDAVGMLVLYGLRPPGAFTPAEATAMLRCHTFIDDVKWSGYGDTPAAAACRWLYYLEHGTTPPPEPEIYGFSWPKFSIGFRIFR